MEKRREEEREEGRVEDRWQTIWSYNIQTSNIPVCEEELKIFQQKAQFIIRWLFLQARRDHRHPEPEFHKIWLLTYPFKTGGSLFSHLRFQSSIPL